MKRKVLLIDLDGTLLGSHLFSLYLSFTIQFVKGLGVQNISTFKALRILHFMKRHIRNSEHQHNGVVNWKKACQFFANETGFSPEKSERVLMETATRCFHNSELCFFPIPQAQDFVSWANKKYRLILATNPLWPLEIVKFRLKLAEINWLDFEFITNAENMSSSKPHVSYYQELAKIRNLVPEECLMIGNDSRKDGPAEKLGIDVFILEKFEDFKRLQKKLEAEQ